MWSARLARRSSEEVDWYVLYRDGGVLIERTTSFLPRQASAVAVPRDLKRRSAPTPFKAPFEPDLTTASHLGQAQDHIPSFVPAQGQLCCTGFCKGREGGPSRLGARLSSRRPAAANWCDAATSPRGRTRWQITDGNPMTAGVCYWTAGLFMARTPWRSQGGEP